MGRGMSEPSADPALTADFKAAMRQLAATVTLVTTFEDGEPHGMTATAVSSLSADPPSVLVCINQSARMHGPTSRSRHFCLNLLAAGQLELCEAFGERRGLDRFGVGEWREGPHQLPWLAGNAATLFCAVDEALNYGTHTIFIGRIEQVEVDRGARPLVYQDGAFGHFAPGS